MIVPRQADYALGIGGRIDLDALKWEFRALGVACSEPHEWEHGGPEWDPHEQMIDINTGSLELTLYDDHTVCIGETDAELLWPDSVEWQVLKLVMRAIGVPD